MSKILFIILFLFIKEYNSLQTNHNIKNITNPIEPGISETFYLDYVDKPSIEFNISENYDYLLQVNIRSINCKINVFSSNNNEIKSANKELYNFILNPTEKKILIEPVKDTSEGFWKENYGLKKCFLSINSYNILNEFEPNIKIENKEETYLYFDTSKYNQINISYNIANVSIDSFASLHFIFEESSFDIDIYYTNGNINSTNSLFKKIEQSTFIYLNNEFLSYNNSDNTGGTLYIKIMNEGGVAAPMFFKIIEENNTCLLTKNALNFGFITSKSTYQYYYTEILEGEEGELMLHNKRLYGLLYGKIMNKSEIKDINELSNTSIYLHNMEDNMLEYNEHKLQLKFDYWNVTSNCKNGCYLLITYEQIKSKEDFPLIGYEYTILPRTWNITDSASSLIEIPSNEYIIGCFEHLTPPIHYYFINIPNDTDKIIIQSEGYYIEAYYERGKKKINTWVRNKDVQGLGQNNTNKNVTILNAADIKSDSLSLLFTYYENYYLSYSYYYFRVLFVKKNETKKYLPVDSILGNLCLPEFNNNTLLYYCHLILKNNYNELNISKFAITSENQNEFFIINVSIMDKNNNKINDNDTTKNFIYVYDKINNDVDYIIFTFEFKNNETKNIISSFYDSIVNIYPQIYSGQLIYLDNSTKINNIKCPKDTFLKYQFIYGDSGIYNYSIKKYDYIKISQNFKGKSFALPLDRDFSFFTNNSKHIFYYQLISALQVQEIEEVKAGETLIRVLTEYYFPIYYYIKIKNKNYVNMDVNIGFKMYNENFMYPCDKFTIKGYIINEKILNHMIMDEFAIIDKSIIANYSDAFGIGFLEVNQKIDNTTENYLLIEIGYSEGRMFYQNSISSVEISYKEFDENNNNTNYSLPVNKYIIESIYGINNETRNENKYCIYKAENCENPILIEISTEYNDTEIIFEDGLLSYNLNENEKEKGFKKYLINNTNNGIINFKVKNNGVNKSNYLIKYSYYDINDAKTFIFNDTNLIVDNESDYITFNYIQVDSFSEVLNNKGTYFFITGTLYKTKNVSDKSLINSDYILNKEDSVCVNNTFNFFNYSNSSMNRNWTLEFKGVPKKDNYSYDLQLQILALPLDNFLNEEYLLYKIEAIWNNSIPYEKKFDSKIYIYIFVPIGAVIVGVAIFFIVKFQRLKKKSDSFKQEMKSLLFSNDIQKNIIINEKELSKNDSDYENTFI